MKNKYQFAYGLAAALMVTTAVVAENQEEGAFANRLDNGKTSCISKHDLEKIQPNTWIEYMKKRGKTCTITKRDNPTPSMWRWEAECKLGNLAPKLYKFNFNRPGNQDNKVLLDSMISNANGEILLKEAFLGEYTGECEKDMEKLRIDTYLELPIHEYESSSLKARESVAGDLIYCGMFLSVLSKIVEPDDVRSAFIELGTVYLDEATKLLDYDEDRVAQDSRLEYDNMLPYVNSAEARDVVDISRNPRCKAFLSDNLEQSINELVIERDKTISTQ
jgi:hypothetical protein